MDTLKPKEAQIVLVNAQKGHLCFNVTSDKKQLTGLSPALIQVAENDILRDEGEEYGRKLEQAGITVTTVRYDSVVHDLACLTAWRRFRKQGPYLYRQK